MKFKYQKYSSEYKDQVINLLDNLWHFDNNAKYEYFKWKYEENPFTQDVVGFIALDGDIVVAFRGYMVEPMQFEDRIFLNAQLADTVTHSGYRRMGLFKSITEYSINELNKDQKFGVSLNSSSGGPTLGGYLKLDWRPLSEREHLFRFTIKGLLDKLLHRKSYFSEYKEKQGELEFIINSENRASDIASIPYSPIRISHIHNEMYYRWRLKNPRNTYRFAYMYSNNCLKAYLILVDLGGGRYDLIDFNCFEVKDLKILLNKFCLKISPLFITIWTVGKHNAIYANRNAFKFWRINIILRHFKDFKKPPFLVRKFNDQNIDVFDPNMWDLYKITADEI